MGHLRQSGLYLAGRIVPALVGVGGVAIYTRLLDPLSMGAFALLLSTSMLASGIGFSWLRIAALRVAAGLSKDLGPNFMATVALSFAGTAVLVGLIEAVAVHFCQPQMSFTLILLATLAAVASAWYDLNASLLQAKLDVAGWGALNLARALAAVIATVLLIFSGMRTEALLGGFILGNLATVAFMKMWLVGFHGKFDSKLFWQCAHFGWPQSVNAAQGYIAPVVQRWMLQVAIGSAAVGIFAVANDFSAQTIASLVGAISLAGIPMAFRAKESGDEVALFEQLRANARLIFAIALPATVGFAILAVQISHTFFGPRFWQGAPLILTLIGFAAFMINLRIYYFDQAFELAMETRPQAAISLIGTTATILATLVLVPRYGAAGAATAALGGSIIGIALSIGWGARVLRMPIPTSDWMRTTLATGGMALALLFVPKDVHALGLLAALLGGGLIYIVLSSVTRLSLLRTQFGARFSWLQRSV